MGPHPLAEGDFFVRFIVALALGVLIGLEREWRQRMAGLHTTAMVSAGAAMFAMIAPLLEAKTVDPTRIVAQVVSGIGFLAGGVILRQGANVRGLTTAATLWATSAVGVLVGFGYLTEAAGTAVLIVLANIALYPLTKIVDAIPRFGAFVVTRYTVEVACTRSSEPEVRARAAERIGDTALTLSAIDTKSVSDADVVVTAQLSCAGREDSTIERFAGELRSIPGVASVQWHSSGEFT